MELLSKLVIGTLGETKTIASSVVAVVAGVGSLLTPSYAPPSLSEAVSPALTYVGMILILVAAALFVALRYKRARDCSECGAEYALEEIGHPEAREVPTEDGIRKTVTRQYRCTECSHETSRTKNELMQESS